MSAADAAPPAAAAPGPFRSRATIPIVLAALLGVGLVLFAWRLPPFRSAVETTDNAYVRGSITVISPKLDGYVAEVPVQDFQTIKAGQLLVRLDDRIPRQRLDQARAELASRQAALANSQQQQRSGEANVRLSQAQIANAQAALVRAQADMNRVNTLIRGGWVSRQQRDVALAALRQAQAGVAQTQAGRQIAQENVASTVVSRGSLAAAVESAQAAVRLAEIDLQNTRIAAPRDGRLGEVGVRVGQYVTPGTQLMALVPEQVWVVANLKETQMANVADGDPATLRVDALNHAQLRAHVERISPAAGSEFSVIRPDNATGNFTKVAQRIPVRLALETGQPLAGRLSPGMSVEVSIHTRKAR